MTTQPDPAAESLRLLRAERDQLEAVLGGLYAEAERVREQIAELRSFEGEYRARLDAYLGDLRATLRMEGRL